MATPSISADTALTYPALHSLRGVAALWVLLFHLQAAVFPEVKPALIGMLGVIAGTFFTTLIDFGWVGVLLFFALSGFLLGNQWIQRPQQSLSNYYLRRAARIYPAVWLQLILLMVFARWLPVHAFMFGEGAAWWFGQITLILDLPPFFVRPLHGVWWTLPIELSFYLVLPFLLVLMRRIGAIAVLVLSLVLTVGWRWAVILHFPEENKLEVLKGLNSLPGVFSVFIAGVAVAWCLRSRSRPSLYWSGLLLVIWLALMQWLHVNLPIYWQGGWTLALWIPLAGLFFGAVIWLAAGRRGCLASAVGLWTGERSYGIYLWHWPALVMTKAYLPDMALLASVILVLMFTFLFAEASYRLVEAPVMRWAKRSTL